MKKNFRYSLCIAALCATSVVSATTIAYLAPRSQGINGARELVGWQLLINRWDACGYYGCFSVTPEYEQTFRSHRITEALFCDALVSDATTEASNGSLCTNGFTVDENCCRKLLIQGSAVTGRNDRALLADYFNMSPFFSSEITFKPKVQNIIVDFNYYQGLDAWAAGLYFRIHAPLVNTRWNLHYCENIIDDGIGQLEQDGRKMKAAELPSNFILNEDFSHFVSSCRGTELPSHLIEPVLKLETRFPTISLDPLKNARWSKCTRTKTGLAEITAAFGWNFVRRENFLLGLNIRAAAPTGTRPHGAYLFEPMVGNGKHWELGGGLNMWWTWWRSCDENRDFTMYVDAYVTHMFKTRQCRTFDIKNKPLSRYMPAFKFTTSVENLTAGPDHIAPDFQIATMATDISYYSFIGTPLANITTIPVDVSYAAQGEVILKFAYTHCNFQFDLGYDFWGRTCPKICSRRDCCNTGFQDNTWGIIGGAREFGSSELLGSLIPLSATESNATIFTRTVDSTNSNIDNPALAYDGNGNPLGDNLNTSLQPKLLTQNDLDICGAQVKAYSNKLFGHVGYIWKDHGYFVPFVGIGGEAEFGCRNKNCNFSCHNSCQPTCHTNYHSAHQCGDRRNSNTNCNKFAFSQWGIWLKGGFSFN